MCNPGKWINVERGIQYLREIAILEVICSDLDNTQLPKDPDEARCKQPMWLKAEHTIIVCQLFGSTDLERRSGTSGG